MRWIELFAATLAAALGWVGVGMYLLAPRLGGVTLSLAPGGAITSSTATRSLLATGVPAGTAMPLLVAALAFALVLLGAWLHARGERSAPWLVSVGAVMAAAVAVLVGSATPYLLPGAALATVCAALSWAPTTAARRA